MLLLRLLLLKLITSSSASSGSADKLLALRVKNLGRSHALQKVLYFILKLQLIGPEIKIHAKILSAPETECTNVSRAPPANYLSSPICIRGRGLGLSEFRK